MECRYTMTVMAGVRYANIESLTDYYPVAHEAMMSTPSIPVNLIGPLAWKSKELIPILNWIAYDNDALLKDLARQ
jgi:hypothetical protein